MRRFRRRSDALAMFSLAGASPSSPAPPACWAASTAARWPRRARTVIATDLDAAGCHLTRAPRNDAGLRHVHAGRRRHHRRRGARPRCATPRCWPATTSTCWSTTPRSTTASPTPRRRPDLSRFESYPLEAFRRALDVNVTGMFLAARCWARRWRSAGAAASSTSPRRTAWSRPISASTAGPTAARRSGRAPAYPASKGAVLAFTRFLATYWAERGVRANSLSPGGVAQAGQEDYFVENYRRRTPLGRMAQPERAARRGGLSGQRRVQLHDGREPGHRRRMDRMVMNDRLPVDGAAAGARAARCAPRGSGWWRPTSTVR